MEITYQFDGSDTYYITLAMNGRLQGPISIPANDWLRFQSCFNTNVNWVEGPRWQWSLIPDLDPRISHWRQPV
jgi:hypothetical protein